MTPQVRLAPQKEQTVAKFDPHSLLTVFVAIAIAAVGALSFVGSLVAWLGLRHSGVMAP